MLEYLLEDRERLFTPTIFFVAGIFYSAVSAAMALTLFPEQASVAHVLLASVAVSPIIFRAISIAADVLDRQSHLVFPIQSWLGVLYFSYLLGAILGFHLSYIFTPEEHKPLLLSEQLKELRLLEGIRVRLSGMSVKEGLFWTILTNNLRVYVIAVLLSFIYGSGGVLLVNWNASIIAALLYKNVEISALQGVAHSLLRIIPHGVLEFMGYFMGGISGVLIGVAVIQEGWNTRLLRDVLFLLISGIFLIFLGALVESGLI